MLPDSILKAVGRLHLRLCSKLQRTKRKQKPGAKGLCSPSQGSQKTRCSEKLLASEPDHGKLSVQVLDEEPLRIR